ncbi:bifunctional phosphopantothenoylcysteine decarboxylase/phosphopantothenate--cysteine ligase CoaBC [Pleionea sediminis]|uniref:bifunctional phosphopantothenoylcysteine decarboxylase/phosphopantothenate--cysteine ligase CoaBC n=1 Tax=Pleionea sediminis TaxID=2569479 RepID=UPI001FE40E4C|nr:bifunctional phosphopantothenoylcysteine decarboxylase/phosphopantothenate--cysteine ligase CoaBC [Pleionea sediminis]
MKRIILGVTGGIAAYKSVELCRRLKDLNCDVRVIMTHSAMEFVSPLTFQAVSGHPVHRDTFDEAAEAAMGHIELARWADQILIAPATANVIARLNYGLADDLLSTVCLASAAPIAIAPAMNQQMWAAAKTQQNTTSIQKSGVQIIGPGEGSQACGEVGAGRLLEPAEIIEELFSPYSDELSGQHWLVTAGPTREPIDPVRFLSNNSSGKMGYAIARAAMRMGAQVTLVSGPVSLPAPPGVERVCVETAEEMLSAVMAKVEKAQVFVGCAAVADYQPVEVAENKIKKSASTMTIELKKNPDIIQQVGALLNKPFCVGFAAETENLEYYAKDKLKRKNLDMICANNVASKDIGFDSNENELTIFFRSADKITLEKKPKHLIAKELVTQIAKNSTNT